MKRLQLEDGTIWPDLFSGKILEIAWMVRHNPKSIAENGLNHEIATLLGSYYELLRMPIRKRQAKIKMIKDARLGN